MVTWNFYDLNAVEFPLSGCGSVCVGLNRHIWACFAHIPSLLKASQLNEKSYNFGSAVQPWTNKLSKGFYFTAGRLRGELGFVL